MEQLKSKLGLAGAAGEAGGSKRAISITATSGSAAERAQQAAGMRSVLFQRSSQQATEDGKLEAEMEAGKISSRCVGGGYSAWWCPQAEFN